MYTSPTISVDDFLNQAKNSLGICLSLDEGHEPEIRKNSLTCIRFAKPLHMPFITASLSICKGIFSICAWFIHFCCLRRTKVAYHFQCSLSQDAGFFGFFLSSLILIINLSDIF